MSCFRNMNVKAFDGAAAGSIRTLTNLRLQEKDTYFFKIFQEIRSNITSSPGACGGGDSELVKISCTDEDGVATDYAVHGLLLAAQSQLMRDLLAAPGPGAVLLLPGLTTNTVQMFICFLYCGR